MWYIDSQTNLQLISYDDPPDGSQLITGSIARSAKRRYLSYSEGDFLVFRPAGATRCTDGGEIWHGLVDRRYTPPCQISPPSVQW